MDRGTFTYNKQNQIKLHKVNLKLQDMCLLVNKSHGTICKHKNYNPKEFHMRYNITPLSKPLLTSCICLALSLTPYAQETSSTSPIPQTTLLQSSPVVSEVLTTKVELHKSFKKVIYSGAFSDIDSEQETYSYADPSYENYIRATLGDTKKGYALNLFIHNQYTQKTDVLAYLEFYKEDRLVLSSIATPFIDHATYDPNGSTQYLTTIPTTAFDSVKYVLFIPTEDDLKADNGSVKSISYSVRDKKGIIKALSQAKYVESFMAPETLSKDFPSKVARNYYAVNKSKVLINGKDVSFLDYSALFSKNMAFDVYKKSGQILSKSPKISIKTSKTYPTFFSCHYDQKMKPINSYSLTVNLEDKTFLILRDKDYKAYAIMYFTK